MKNLSKAVALTAVVLTASACSIESSLFGVKLPDLLPFQKSQTAEVVSGSSQYVETLNPDPLMRYRVSTSVGSVYAEIKDQTVSGNYKVYLSVQGQMISDDETSP